MEVDQFFRAGVGALVINEDGLVLAAQRSDIGDAWQAPQGGIEHSERPIEALQRELSEELGVSRSDIEVVAEYSEWLAYELPQRSWSSKTGRGQTQRWFLVRVSADAVDSMGSAEFSGHRWVTIGQLLDDAWDVRRTVYQRLAHEWSDHFAH